MSINNNLNDLSLYGSQISSNDSKTSTNITKSKANIPVLKADKKLVQQKDYRHDYEFRKNKTIDNIHESRKKLYSSQLIDDNKEKSNDLKTVSQESMLSTLEFHEDALSRLDVCAIHLGRLVLNTILRKKELTINDSLSRFFLDNWLHKFGSNIKESDPLSIELLALLQKGITEVTTKLLNDEDEGIIAGSQHLREASISKSLCALGMEALDSIIKGFETTNPVLHEIKAALLPAIYSEFPFTEEFDGMELFHLERLFKDSVIPKFQELPGIGLPVITDLGNSNDYGLPSIIGDDEEEDEEDDEDDDYDNKKTNNISKKTKISGQKYLRFKTWHECFCDIKEKLRIQDLKVKEFFNERDKLYSDIKKLNIVISNKDEQYNKLLNEKNILNNLYVNLTNDYNNKCKENNSLNEVITNNNQIIKQLNSKIDNNNLTIQSNNDLINQLNDKINIMINNQLPDIREDYYILLQNFNQLQESNNQLVNELDNKNELIENITDLQLKYKNILIQKYNYFTNTFSSLVRYHNDDEKLINLCGMTLNNIIGLLDPIYHSENLFEFYNIYSNYMVQCILSYQIIVKDINNSLNNEREMIFKNEVQYKYELGQLKSHNKNTLNELESQYINQINELNNKIANLQNEIIVLHNNNLYLSNNSNDLIIQRDNEWKVKIEELEDILYNYQDKLDMVNEDNLYLEKYTNITNNYNDLLNYNKGLDNINNILMHNIDSYITKCSNIKLFFDQFFQSVRLMKIGSDNFLSNENLIDKQKEELIVNTINELHEMILTNKRTEIKPNIIITGRPKTGKLQKLNSRINKPNSINLSNVVETKINLVDNYLILVDIYVKKFNNYSNQLGSYIYKLSDDINVGSKSNDINIEKYEKLCMKYEEMNNYVDLYNQTLVNSLKNNYKELEDSYSELLNEYDVTIDNNVSMCVNDINVNNVDFDEDADRFIKIDRSDMIDNSTMTDDNITIDPFKALDISIDYTSPRYTTPHRSISKLSNKSNRNLDNFNQDEVDFQSSPNNWIDKQIDVLLSNKNKPNLVVSTVNTPSISYKNQTNFVTTISSPINFSNNTVDNFQTMASQTPINNQSAITSTIPSNNQLLVNTDTSPINNASITTPIITSQSNILSDKVSSNLISPNNMLSYNSIVSPLNNQAINQTTIPINYININPNIKETSDIKQTVENLNSIDYLLQQNINYKQELQLLHEKIHLLQDLYDDSIKFIDKLTNQLKNQSKIIKVDSDNKITISKVEGTDSKLETLESKVGEKVYVDTSAKVNTEIVGNPIHDSNSFVDTDQIYDDVNLTIARQQTNRSSKTTSNSRQISSRLSKKSNSQSNSKRNSELDGDFDNYISIDINEDINDLNNQFNDDVNLDIDIVYSNIKNLLSQFHLKYNITYEIYDQLQQSAVDSPKETELDEIDNNFQVTNNVIENNRNKVEFNLVDNSESKLDQSLDSKSQKLVSNYPSQLSRDSSRLSSATNPSPTHKDLVITSKTPVGVVDYIRRNEKQYAKDIGRYKVVIREAKRLYSNVIEKLLVIASPIPNPIPMTITNDILKESNDEADEDKLIDYDINRINNEILESFNGNVNDKTKLLLTNFIDELKQQADTIFDFDKIQERFINSNSNMNPIEVSSQLTMLQSYEEAKIQAINNQSDNEIIQSINNIISNLNLRVNLHGGWKSLLYLSDGTIDPNFNINDNNYSYNDKINILNEIIQYLYNYITKLLKKQVSYSNKYYNKIKKLINENKYMKSIINDLSIEVGKPIDVNSSIDQLVRIASRHSNTFNNENEDPNEISIEKLHEELGIELTIDPNFEEKDNDGGNAKDENMNNDIDNNNNNLTDNLTNPSNKKIFNFSNTQLNSPLENLRIIHKENLQRDLAIYHRIKRGILEGTIETDEIIYTEHDFNKLVQCIEYNIQVLHELTHNDQFIDKDIDKLIEKQLDKHINSKLDKLIIKDPLDTQSIDSRMVNGFTEPSIEILDDTSSEFSFINKLIPKSNNQISGPMTRQISQPFSPNSRPLTQSLNRPVSQQIYPYLNLKEPLKFPQRTGNKSYINATQVDGWRKYQNDKRFEKAKKILHDKMYNIVDDDITDKFTSRPLTNKAHDNHNDDNTVDMTDKKDDDIGDINNKSGKAIISLTNKIKSPTEIINDVSNQLNKSIDSIISRVLFTVPINLNNENDISKNRQKSRENTTDKSSKSITNHINEIYTSTYPSKSISLYPSVYEKAYSTSDVVKYAKNINSRINEHINEVKRLEQTLKLLSNNYNMGTISNNIKSNTNTRSSLNLNQLQDLHDALDKQIEDIEYIDSSNIEMNDEFIPDLSLYDSKIDNKSDSKIDIKSNDIDVSNSSKNIHPLQHLYRNKSYKSYPNKSNSLPSIPQSAPIPNTNHFSTHLPTHFDSRQPLNDPSISLDSDKSLLNNQLNELIDEKPNELVLLNLINPSNYKTKSKLKLPPVKSKSIRLSSNLGH